MVVEENESLGVLGSKEDIDDRLADLVGAAGGREWVEVAREAEAEDSGREAVDVDNMAENMAAD